MNQDSEHPEADAIGGAGEASPPCVALEGVSCSFDDILAVDAVDLDVRRGEIFCLLGGSGCGKTTLLRLLAGFEKPSAGSIRIDGVDMLNVPPHRRPVNMMFQSYALFPHMTVAQNVAFGLRQEGIPRAETARRVDEILEMVQLDALHKRKPQQLSGGQQQRVALARSLVKRPKLLLLDEPLGALDKKLREKTQFELLKLQERLGVTFVMVTHDQQEAMSLATRIGVMREGRIIQVGTPGEIYESPRNRFVADFVGSVNLFEGKLCSAGTGVVTVDCAAAGGPLSAVAERPRADGTNVWIAVRPEKIRLSHQPPQQETNVFACTVDEVAYRGEQSIYLVRMEGGMQVRVTRPNFTRLRAQAPGGKGQVWIHWDPASGVVLEE